MFRCPGTSHGGRWSPRAGSTDIFRRGGDIPVAPMPPNPVIFKRRDLTKLKEAVALLEKNSLLTMLARAAGRPVTGMLGALPNFANDAIQKAARKAIMRCLSVALRPRGAHSPLAIAGRFPAMTSGIAGAAAGFAGLPGVAVELPLTTLIMFQSIAHVAASAGEDLSSPEVRLACLEVFALSTDGRGPGATKTGYYAARNALAKSMDEASSYVLRRSTAQETGPALVQLVSAIASRFGLLVSEELAAAAIPVLGAATGASLNVAFVQHFNNIARGHFAVRALEREYGETEVRERFERIRMQSHKPKVIKRD